MSAFTGTLRLARLALRRDRITVPVWILGLTAFLGATTTMFVSTLVTYADRVQEAAIPTENVGLHMLGLTSGPSVGGAVMMRDLVLLSVMAALMNVLLVVRHTRQGEEIGRADVVDATVVGRCADLAAALLVAVGADVVLAVSLAISMIVNGLSVTGAITAGAGVAGVGVVFAGVAAVAVQLASSTRGAVRLSSAVLGVAFVLSGVGNMLGTADTEALRVESAWPAWLSPIGWAQQMRPFGGDHVWPLLGFVLLFAALVAVAGALVQRRDVGTGIWPQRRGRSQAASSLLSPAGLVFRLQRGVLAGWMVALAGFGLIFGAMTAQIRDARPGSFDFYEHFGGREHVVQAFYASMASMGAMLVAVYLTQMVLRMHAEEADGTLESLLGSGVTRLRWALGHLVTAGAGAVSLLLAYCLGMGATAGQVVGDSGAQMEDALRAGVVQLPAVLTVGAVVLAFVGLVPRLAVPLGWSVVVVAGLAGPIFGPPLRLPQLVIDLSPFSLVPAVPAVAAGVSGIATLTAVCLTLAVLGVVAVRHRDLVLPA